ncbi:MAG: glutamate racemase [Anaerolineae bacterium]|nr:glutamate racemase [Anaerolineae bacterium]
MPSDPRPIAMLDSGVGGLSILREIRRRLPNEDILYFADQGHVPYGPRPLAEIQGFVRGIAQFFLRYDAKVIVLACNAASAAGLHDVRRTLPEVPFIGMEPAIKPAAERTRNGAIGVITTEATYQGELFTSVVDRFAGGIEVVTQVCPEFVTLVEAGQIDGAEVYRVTQSYLAPLLDANIDELVLGCTHFPFLTPVIQTIVGNRVDIIDPGPAVALQAGRMVSRHRNAPEHVGRVTYFTSGAPAAFLNVARRLVDEDIEDRQVMGVRWIDGEIVLSAKEL